VPKSGKRAATSWTPEVATALKSEDGGGEQVQSLLVIVIVTRSQAEYVNNEYSFYVRLGRRPRYAAGGKQRILDTTTMGKDTDSPHKWTSSAFSDFRASGIVNK
jgi:hypothetical protein